MARPKIVTDNESVADWLLSHNWFHDIDDKTRSKLPEYVDDALWASIYTCAGTSKSSGRVNVSPKLVKRAIMLPEISVKAVQRLNIFSTPMSERKAQTICQCVRYTLRSLEERVKKEMKKNASQETEFNYRLERQWIESYYSGVNHEFDKVLPKTPKPIQELYIEGKIEEYKQALKSFHEEVELPQ